MTFLSRSHQQHHGAKAEGAGGGGGGGMMARARGLVRHRQVGDTSSNIPSPAPARPGASGASGAEAMGLSSQTRPRQQSSRVRSRRQAAAPGTAMSGRPQQAAPRNGSPTRMRQVQGQQMRGARSAAPRAAGARPPPERQRRSRTGRPASSAALLGATGESSRTTPPRNRPQHSQYQQQRQQRDGPSAVGRSSSRPTPSRTPSRSSRPAVRTERVPSARGERVLSARTNARSRPNINVSPSQKRLTAQHKELSESFRRKRREESRRKLGWEPGAANTKKRATATATATATAASATADPPVKQPSHTHRSNLDASKFTEGQFETIREQSLRTAHDMPTANASLHVVEKDTRSALPASSQRKLGEQSLSVTSLFSWSNTSFDNQIKGLAEESEKKEEDEAVDSLAALPPPVSPTKRSSMQTATTEGSHATAVVDNLTSSTSNLFQADEDRHLASKEQEGASVLPATTSDATELAANVEKEGGVDQDLPPSPPTTSPVADRGSRQLTTNNDYLNFAAKASTRKKIVDDTPQTAPLAPVTSSRRSSLSGSHRLSASDESTEFLRFRSEAAEFGKRNLIADAVADLEAGVVEDVEDTKMQEPHADDKREETVTVPIKDDSKALPETERPGSPPLLQQRQDEGNPDDDAPTAPRKIQAAPSADAAPRPQGQLRTLPPPLASQQRVRQRPGMGHPSPVRETDTACTIADANDSIFPQESAKGTLDEHIDKTRPPRMVGMATTSKSSVSSLSKPAPPHKKIGTMGRLLRNKKKKKDKKKLRRGVSGKSLSRGMPQKASGGGRKPSLATILSERLVHGLHDSLTSVGSSMRNIGGGQRRILNEDSAAFDPNSHIMVINSVLPNEHVSDAPVAATAAPIEPTPVTEPLKVKVDFAGGRDGLSREGSTRSAKIQKGEQMLMKWRNLGIDIATKQLDAGQAYYETGDLERARRCFSQVASLDHPIEGDDDATVVLIGLVTEAKSMLVKIDSVQSIGQLEDGAQPHPVVKSVTSDATNDVEGAATGHVPAAAVSAADTPTIAQIPEKGAAADTPTIAQIPEKGDARDDSSASQNSESDIFVSVRNAFFEPEAEGDAATPVAAMVAQSQSIAVAATASVATSVTSW